jgi:hypothetical protein
MWEDMTEYMLSGPESFRAFFHTISPGEIADHYACHHGENE